MGYLYLIKITFSINVSALEGYIIKESTQSTKIYIDNCLKKTTTSLSIIKIGLAKVRYGILNIYNFNIKELIIQERSVIKVDEGTNVGLNNISGSQFENIQRTGDNQKGGVNEGYLVSNNGKFTVSSTFKDCKVSNSNGIEGAFYIKISEDLMNITAVSIRTKSSLSKTKIGAQSDEYEKADLNNIMGYDGTDTSLAIPLYYVYTDINQQIYHVKNADSTPNGIDI
ncbi:MAG: hypothetical protein EZS28_040306 [Streblomastix strix]|uniref:Uncharacterized protein n=1 Tax=Streblomastix strix TaxID=222440 RepID=A0A5J4U0U3_9EUKA|nr:MAG: hypothetical protein EZS28_040306 [Streblomastix strix]